LGARRAAQRAVVGLTEQGAALAVADDRPAHAELDEHRRRNLAGERPVVLPVDVLGAEDHRRAGQQHRRVGQRGEGRADHDLDGAG
jgi:hypothetical protein